MKLKSYFAATVEAAMELARREMGEDALLVHARPATPETRYLGAYEVVFGVIPCVVEPNPVEPNPEDAASHSQPIMQAPPLGRGSDRGPDQPLAKAPAAARAARTTGLKLPTRQLPEAQAAITSRSAEPDSVRTTPLPTKSEAEFAQHLQFLKSELERLSVELKNGAANRPEPKPDAAESSRSSLIAQLTAEEIDSALAHKIAGGTPFESCFSVDPRLGRSGHSRAVVALVGPPGAGKTTTLVKLAARYGLIYRRPARILTCDVQRIAAVDQLRAMAAILGIGCDVCETPLALAQSLEEHRGKDLVLIDTPGFSFREMEDAADLARLIASNAEIDPHLVLPASMKADDLARAVTAFAAFAPRHLLFTRLDETAHYGALVSLSARSGLPISFLTTGQQIPDDLEAASMERFRELVLSDSPVPASARAAGKGAAA